jgi:hypothetical protein
LCGVNFEEEKKLNCLILINLKWLNFYLANLRN